MNGKSISQWQYVVVNYMLATKLLANFTHVLPRSQAWLEEVHVKLAKTIASGIDGGYFCNKDMGYMENMENIGMGIYMGK